MIMAVLIWLEKEGSYVDTNYVELIMAVLIWLDKEGAWEWEMSFLENLHPQTFICE